MVHEQTALIGRDAPVPARSWKLTVFIACLNLFAMNFVNYAVSLSRFGSYNTTCILTRGWHSLFLSFRIFWLNAMSILTTEWTTIILGLWAFTREVSGTLIGIVANDIPSMRKSTLISLGLMAVSAPPMFVCSGIGNLVFARVLHGTASGVITISSMFLVSVQVPPQEKGAAMGWVALAMTLGCLFGSASGGPLYQYAGGVDIVVISEVLLLFNVFLMIYESKQHKTIVATAGNSSQEPAQANADTERQMDKPLLGLLSRRLKNYSSTFLFLIRQRRVITMVFSMSIPCVCLACLEAVLPNFMKRSFGWSQTQMSFVWFLQSFPQLASPLVGTLVDRHGTRLSLRIGFTETAFALACMAIVQQDSIVEIGVFGTMIVLMTVGTLLVVVPSMASISKFMDLATEQGQSDPGTAVAQSSALLNLAMTVPGMVGPTWGNVAMRIGGWPILCLSLASLNAVGWLTIPSRETRDELESDETFDEI